MQDTSSTLNLNMEYGWGDAQQVSFEEFPDRIEVIYKQRQVIYTNITGPRERVFKIIYSVVDGKWNKSEPIFGKIIPPKEEEYEFDNLDTKLYKF